MSKHTLTNAVRDDWPLLWLVWSRDDDAAPPRLRAMLSDERPMLVLPALACEVGLGEAVFLQQLHYWLQGDSAKVRDGRRWVYNTLEDWGRQFPFWSRSTLHRTIGNLERAGLIVGTAKYNRSKIDRTKWYSINYDAPCLVGLREGVRTISQDDGVRTISQIPEMDDAFPGNGISIQIPEMGNALTIERLPTESSEPNPRPKSKPLPENGPAQVLVKRYCGIAGIEKPAVYGIAVGAAQKLVNAGITPDDLTAIYCWLKEQTWVKGGIDLPFMLKQVDAWRSDGSPGRGRGLNGHDSSPPDAITVEIERIRSSDDLRYFGTIGMQQRAADIAELEAKREQS